MPPVWFDAGGFKLYFYRREEHRRPRVAVVQGKQPRATVAIDTGELLAGQLNAQELRRVQAILVEHREAALAAFEAARTHQPMARLDAVEPHEGGET